MRPPGQSRRRPALPMLLGVLCVLPAATAQEVELETVVQGLARPLHVTHAGDGSGRIFIVEQGGRILIHGGGGLRSQPFLDLSSEVSSGGERGLLGLAFHPAYADTGFFFVNYTDRTGDTVIARFSVSADPDRADPGSEVEVLSFRQPFSNHNGGHLAFGPDGYLYIGSGDGGSGGDPQNNGQSLDTLLGKILRIDVDGLPFAVPPDNPFVGGGNRRPEIWAYGLRNPWRFSFDRRTGDLFIGDVGQDREEEIDFQAAASDGGENYGWRRKEGSLCFQPASGCDSSGLTDPVLVYGRGAGCSVTGGYRYRGRANPGLVGTYVFGDFCSGTIWGADPRADGTWTARVLIDTSLSISSFGEDEAGEIYVVDLGGRIQRIAGSSLLTDDFESGDTAIWKKTRGQVVVVQPGLGGSDHALQVTLDGSGAKSLVLTTAPRRRSSLSVRLLLATSALDLAGEVIEILRLAGGGGAPLVAVTLSPHGGARFRASLWVFPEVGEPVLVGSTNVKPGRDTRLGFNWRAATSPTALDGLAELVKGRRVRAAAVGLGRGASAPQSFRLGLPSGSAGTAGGGLLFDDVLISP